MYSLAGQVAVVTGSSRGIGRAIARALAGQGAKVVVNYVTNEEAAQYVVQQIVAQGGAATAVKADVSQADQAHMLIDKALEL
jgi:NAD(P)-dependent dehydrogenase (short-subunit alcohol dehydrogenase family)